MDTTGLDDFLTEKGFSGVVLVRDGDTPVYEAVRGLASKRWNIPNTLDTRFDTASITKLFTSVSVLQQVGLGNLDLETSIHHYVDLEGTTISPKVTLLHLLTHSSGLKDDADEEAGEDYSALWIDKPTYSVTEASHFLPQFAYLEPLAEPGTQVRYNNVAYILAGLALERATGESYRDYVKREVFEKAGMVDSGFFDRRDPEPRVAEGYEKHEDGSWFQNIFSYPPIGTPDGGAHVTAEDLLRFIRSARDGTLLDAEFTEEFLTPQVDHPTLGIKVGFGLEFDLEEDGSVRSYYKDGDNIGAAGIVRHYLESGIEFVMLANIPYGAWDVVREIDARLGG